MIRDIAKKIKRLLGYAADTRFHMTAAILGYSVRGLLSVWMIADFLGNATLAFETGNPGGIWRALLLAMPWLALILAVQALSAWLTGVTTASMTVSMRKNLMEVMLSSPLKEAHNSHSGSKLSYYTNDIPAAAGSVVRTLSVPVEALIMGVGCFIYVVRVHWVMALISIVIGMLTYIYSVLFAGKLHRTAVKMQALRSMLEVRVKTLLDGIVTARMYGMRDRLESEMNGTSEDLMRTGVSWAWTSGFLGGMNNAASRLSSNVLIFAAGLLFLADAVSLPELMRVSHMAGGVIGVFHVSRLLVDIQQSLAGCERVFEYIDGAKKESGSAAGTESESESAEKADEADGVEEVGELDELDGVGEVNPGGISEPVIAFENVTFGYDGSPVINNFSFTASRGEMIALAGRSGNGKSTLLRLIQGLYEKEAGRIEIFGVPIERWDLHALRNITALVPQEPVLFPGTVAQNIALGCDLSYGRAEQAAKDAGAHNFIKEMPDGYDTVVSERGQSLSGGQRQRIAIARALYRGAPVLLLDEATSAMDSESEAVVYETLRRLKGEKTILFVTHRASVLNIADRTVIV